MNKILMRLFGISIGLLLVGCGTFSLQSNAKMTQSLFFKDLEPTKTIFLAATNTTSSDSNISSGAKSILEGKGYAFVDKPSEAKYILRINVLNANGQREQNEAKAAGVAGFTSALVVGSATRSSNNGLVAGIAGAAIGGVFAFATADGNIRMQVDVLITENSSEGAIDHKTRVIAEATQVHLTPEEGQPILEKIISKKIAGIFL